MAINISGIGIANAIGFNKFKMGGIASIKPIASYRCYDKTNDDADRNVLTDLTGNGHDIQLYNFAFTEESGYNKSTYKGALVSDGVDDYGLCENFQILTKEKGYTVVALRKWINLTINNGYSSLVTNGTDRLNGAFSLELIGNSEENLNGSNFGSFIGTIYNHYNDTCVSQTSKKYNQYEYNRIGTIEEGSNILKIFKASPYNYYSSIALYALEIYDRDLTDEEIAKVKSRMIAEYEAKTGNKYEEETT